MGSSTWLKEENTEKNINSTSRIRKSSPKTSLELTSETKSRAVKLSWVSSNLILTLNLAFIEKWEKGEATVDDIPDKKRKRSRSRSSSRFSMHSDEEDNTTFINVIGRHNIDIVLQKKAKISISCLVRLRMYQLADGIELSPDGNMVFKIKPQLENRINILGVTTDAQ